MTNDEILYAMNEIAVTFEDYRTALEARLKGKNCAYGDNKSFVIDRVSAVTTKGGHGPYAYVCLEGRMHKKDGTFHKHAHGRVRLESAKFLD